MQRGQRVRGRSDDAAVIAREKRETKETKKRSEGNGNRTILLEFD